MKNIGRFSNYAGNSPVEYHFKRDPGLKWYIKYATAHDEHAMMIFATSAGIFIGTNGQPVTRYPNIVEIAWREIAILFAGTNIPAQEIDQDLLDACATQEEVDKLVTALPRLSNNATIDQVEALIGSMPQVMVVELWKALGEINPGWGPRKEEK